MSDRLPQLSGDLFIADGGMETTLIFHDGLDLPCFASFTLLGDSKGREALEGYFDAYVGIARQHGVGAVLDAPTWRANPDWGDRLGYTAAELDEANRGAVALVEKLRPADGDVPIVISGCIGPRGDAYRPAELMTASEAQEYHSTQIKTLSETAADLVTGLTITYAEEAIGIARAARAVDMPVVISFTVETDGRLPSGQTLREAIEQVDAETDGVVSYFMVNCAHPTHFAAVLEDGGPWLDRIRGIRANASTKSHAELDDAEDLDAGDPADLAARYVALRPRLRHLNVLGGCCGTDHSHIAAICTAWQAST